MMALLACCLYLLLMVLVGYAVLSAIHPANRMPFSQLTTLSAVIGAGTMGLLLFWASLIGFAPSRPLLATIGSLALIGLLVMGKTKRRVQVGFRPADWQKSEAWMLVPLTMTAAGLVIIAVVALSTPLSDWDAFAIWGFKAKVLIHEALRPTPAYFHDLTLSYSHLDYPLMLPFLTAGAYAAMGTIDDQTGKIVSAFLDILVVPMVYLGLRWKLQRLPAACLAAIPALLPVMFRYAGAGSADVPLAMFYAGSILYVVRWIDQQQGKDLILAILFSTFAAFTKNEGLVLALANGAVMLGFGLWHGPRRAWMGALAFFAGLLALDAAWLIWNRGLPRTFEDYGSKLLSPLLLSNLPRLKQIIPTMMLQTVEFHIWGLMWLMAGVMAWLGWRAFARRYVLALWLLLGLHLLSYVLAYMVTPWDFNVLVPMTMYRLLLHTVPAVILLAGWHWAETGNKPASPLETTGVTA
jgi:hypothetical protein